MAWDWDAVRDKRTVWAFSGGMGEAASSHSGIVLDIERCLYE